MSNLRRMLSRAMRTSPWDDGKKDREWGMTKRRQRRIEQRETERLTLEAVEYATPDGPDPTGPLVDWEAIGATEPAEVQSMADGDRHMVRRPR